MDKLFNENSSIDEFFGLLEEENNHEEENNGFDLDEEFLDECMDYADSQQQGIEYSECVNCDCIECDMNPLNKYHIGEGISDNILMLLYQNMKELLVIKELSNDSESNQKIKELISKLEIRNLRVIQMIIESR